jgi:hypothetical protein
VIEFEVLSEQHQKLETNFTKALKSLAEVPVVKPKTIGGAAPHAWETDYAAWRKLGVNERAGRIVNEGLRRPHEDGGEQGNAHGETGPQDRPGP